MIICYQSHLLREPGNSIYRFPWILPSHPFHLIRGLSGAKYRTATFFSGHDPGGPLPGVGVEKGRLDGVDVFFWGLEISRF